MTLYACSRQGVDLGLTASDPNTVIKYAKLDISSQESVSRLAQEVKSELDGQDSKLGEGRVVLINNAATVVTPHTAENSKAELDVNYRGTLKVTIPGRFESTFADIGTDVSCIHPYPRSPRENCECQRDCFRVLSP